MKTLEPIALGRLSCTSGVPNQKKPTSTRQVAASSLPVAGAGAWRRSRDIQDLAMAGSGVGLGAD